MAVKALDLAKTIDVTVPWDDGDDPTTWKVGVLTSRDVGAIRDSVTSVTFKTGGVETDEGRDMTTTVSRSKMNFEAVRRGLRGWSNFIGPDDKPVEFKTHQREVDGKQRDVVRPELLDLIPLSVINHLADIILRDNEMGEDDVGN